MNKIELQKGKRANSCVQWIWGILRHLTSCLTPPQTTNPSPLLLEGLFMTKIDEIKSKPATSVSCCILFVALHGDTSAKILAEQAAAEYLQSFQQSVQRTGCTCRQIDEHTIEVNVNCVVHGRNAASNASRLNQK